MQKTVCPIHNREMVLRKGKFGNFWSCPSKNEDGSWCQYRPRNAPVSGRQVAEARFEQELAEDKRSQQIKEFHEEKVENIARSVALNNATEFFKEASGRWAKFSDYDECIVELFKLADEMYSWLKKEGGDKV